MGLLTGFTTILVVIACGWALAHIGVLDAGPSAPSARSPSSSPRPHSWW